VIVASGYSADLGVVPAGGSFLPKPFALATLAAAVREELDAARG